MTTGTTRRWLPAALALVVGILAILFFFQTRDPMVLIFGVIAAFMILAIASAMTGGGFGGFGPPDAGAVRVRCASCRALNPEDARYCNQCGKPM